MSINLPYSLAWNTVVKSGQMLLAVTWICGMNYRNGYVGLLVQHMLPPLKPWLIVEMLRALVFPVFGLCSSELAELDPLSYLGWRSTHYPNRLYDFAVTISKCYKDVYINNFLTQLDPGILYLPNAFL